MRYDTHYYHRLETILQMRRWLDIHVLALKRIFVRQACFAFFLNETRNGAPGSPGRRGANAGNKREWIVDPESWN